MVLNLIVCNWHLEYDAQAEDTKEADETDTDETGDDTDDATEDTDDATEDTDDCAEPVILNNGL